MIDKQPIIVVNMMSIDEVNKASAIATQEALVELGKQTAKLELESQLKADKLLNIEKYLIEYQKSIPVGVEYTRRDSQVVTYVNRTHLNNYFSNVKEYIELVNNKFAENSETIDLQKCELKEINKEIKIANQDCEHAEITLDEHEKYWSTRVEKLRNKCKYKNKIIKFYNYLFLTLLLLVIVYNVIKYRDIVISICYNVTYSIMNITFNIFYICFTNSFSITLNIIKKICFNLYNITNLVVYYRYLFICDIIYNIYTHVSNFVYSIIMLLSNKYALISSLSTIYLLEYRYHIININVKKLIGIISIIWLVNIVYLVK